MIAGMNSAPAVIKEIQKSQKTVVYDGTSHTGLIKKKATPICEYMYY